MLGVNKSCREEVTRLTKLVNKSREKTRSATGIAIALMKGIETPRSRVMSFKTKLVGIFIISFQIALKNAVVQKSCILMWVGRTTSRELPFISQIILRGSLLTLSLWHSRGALL